MRALIVDDEAPARRRLRAALAELPAVAAVEECAGGREALAAVRRNPPDLLFLDIEMPEVDGLAVAAAARGEQRPAVVFVTAYEQYAVRAFEMEALDYLLKPFADERVAEAVRRAEAYLRFIRRGAPLTIDRFGDVSVEYATHRVTRGGRVVDLRPREYELLVALLKRGGAIARRDELLREVWGYAASVVSRTVDTHVRALRTRLERDPAQPQYILTVRHCGYRLDRFSGEGG
jgi:DNA-binding response OmpR family regulator